ncbi:MAG: FAD-binding domain-containing protein [Bacteroidota bacterium]
MKSKVNIVWLKRDVRWHDHAVLSYAEKSEIPVIIMYLFEPSMIGLPESDVRHWRFAFEGITEFSSRAEQNRIVILYAEALEVLHTIAAHYQINSLLSHQETGLEATYRRDQKVRNWCKCNGTTWKTFARDGVIRNTIDRVGWQDHWEEYMNTAEFSSNPQSIKFQEVDFSIFNPIWQQIPEIFQTRDENFQQGGEGKALKLLSSFSKERATEYLRNLARPHESQSTCSRLSPYMAYGHISARRAYQISRDARDGLGKNVDQFHDRLWWRCHYIQKLETEYQIEKNPINRGFVELEKPYRADFFEAWSTGNTGFPMVDAAIRSLVTTGYINFRMRAMLSTFWAFTLWQEWKIGAAHLARVFLDFEPGIHYPQFQMQAGMTGYHPLRIFNPIIQTEKYDEEGKFIRRWIPELERIPKQFLARPWTLSAMEQLFYKTEIGVEYPLPIVNYDAATRAAKEKYWDFRNSDAVRRHLPELWKKHSLPEDISNYVAELKINPELVTKSIMYSSDRG